MSNKEKLEVELKTQYELITGEQKTVTEGVFDAVHAATGARDDRGESGLSRGL